MPYGYYGFYWMDYTYIFVIIGAVICLIASAGMNSTFSRYQHVRSMSGMTGAMAAERILGMQVFWMYRYSIFREI